MYIKTISEYNVYVHATRMHTHIGGTYIRNVYDGNTLKRIYKNNAECI